MSRYILLALLLAGCDEASTTSDQTPTIIFQFLDNQDACTPERVTVEVGGEVYETVDLGSDSELVVYREGDAMDVYFDLEDSVCGDSTTHTQITTTNETRVYPFYY